MVKWKYKIDVIDIWSSADFHDADTPSDEYYKEIAARLRESAWFQEHEQTLGPAFYTLAELVDELESADSPEVFNYWWGRVYDLSDETRCWIATAL